MHASGAGFPVRSIHLTCPKCASAVDAFDIQLRFLANGCNPLAYLCKSSTTKRLPMRIQRVERAVFVHRMHRALSKQLQLLLRVCHEDAFVNAERRVVVQGQHPRYLSVILFTLSNQVGRRRRSKERRKRKQKERDWKASRSF